MKSNIVLRLSILVVALGLTLQGCGDNGGGASTVQTGGSVQGKSLSLTGAVTTFAGTNGTYGSADGIGAAAQFWGPEGLTTDGKSLFVADAPNFTIRKIDISSGAVTTLAGSAGSQGSSDGTGAAARFSAVCGITTDGTHLYVTDATNHTIRKIVIAKENFKLISGEWYVSWSVRCLICKEV